MACLDYRLASLIACLELSAGASFGLLLSEGVSEDGIKALMVKHTQRK